MSCRAKIRTNSADVLTVPVGAVLYRSSNTGQAPYVLAVEAGRAHRKDVELGAVNQEVQQVLKGINDGEEIIVGPYRTLRDVAEGDRIRPQSASR
jgi:HlyD family secretion protein